MIQNKEKGIWCFCFYKHHTRNIMGLTNSEIIQILQCKKGYKAKTPSLCMIGKQNILIQWNKFVRELKSFEFEYDDELLEKIKGIKPIDSFTFFKMLGFGEVSALDYSDYEGADILFDLNNDDIPYELKEKYDFIINGGTLEHIFNVSNAIRNISELAKVGGIIYHVSPLAGWIDHGFYSISPTFYIDYYKGNKWEIKSVNMEFLNKHGNSLYSQDCRLFSSSMEINEYIKSINSNDYQHVLLQCIIEKTAAGLIQNNPMQGYYAGIYKIDNKPLDYEKIVNFIKKSGKRKIGLYGAGHDGMQVLENNLRNNMENIYCFYDRDINKVGTTIAGIEVKYPTIKNIEEVEMIIITSAKFENEIYEQLLNISGAQREYIVRGSMI